MTTAINTECLYMADQLRRAFDGDAWHGPAVTEILEGIGAAQALERPIPSAHSIWELVLHIAAWERVALAAIQGVPMPKALATEEDFPRPAGNGDPAWQTAVSNLLSANQSLCRAVRNFGDARLAETVPGRGYDFRQLFTGLTQHALYHAGQMALLKKAVPVKS